MNKKNFFALLSLIIATTIHANAATISQWTFESSIPTTGGPFSPEVGSGTGTAFHANSSTVFSNPVGNGSGESWSANNWTVGDYWQFQISTIGYQNIIVNWDQTRSSTGPATFDFAYSLDGSGFTVFLDNYTVPATSWSTSTADSTGNTSFSVNLTSILALNDDSAIYLRLIADSSASSSAGSGRIDNFTVSGTARLSAVPETLPFAFVILFLSGLLFSHYLLTRANAPKLSRIRIPRY